MIQASAAFIEQITSDAYTIRARLLNGTNEIPGEIISLVVHKGAAADRPIPGSIFLPYLEGEIRNCDIDLTNIELTYQLGVVTNFEEVITEEAEEELEWITIGLFTPIAPKISGDTTTFTAVSRLGLDLAGRLYESSLTYPASIEAVISELESLTETTLQFIGITPGGTLNNKLTGLTVQQALGYVASFVGGFVTENNVGEIVIAKYGSGALREVTEDQYQSFPDATDLPFIVTGLKVIVTPEGEAEDGSIIPEVAFTQGVEPYLTVENPYMTQSLFNTCASNIIGVSVNNATINMHMGDPRLESWDAVSVSNGQTTNEILCLQLTHSYMGGLTTEIITNAKTEEETLVTRTGPLAEQVEQINAELFTAKQAIINRATVQQLEAAIANIDTGYITEAIIQNARVTNFTGTKAQISTLLADEFTAQQIETILLDFDQAIGNTLSLNTLDAQKAQFENLLAGSFTADEINVISAAFSTATITSLTTESLTAQYAKINFANIKTESVEELFVNVGLIENATIQDGKITGTLSGVRVVADVIEANTVVTGDLLVRSEEDPNTYYKINVSESGVTEETLRDCDYNKYISGQEILAKSITAEKVTVSDLVAFGATIGGFQINADAIRTIGKASATSAEEGVYIGSGQELARVSETVNVTLGALSDGAYPFSLTINKELTSGDTIEEVSNFQALLPSNYYNIQSQIFAWSDLTTLGDYIKEILPEVLAQANWPNFGTAGEVSSVTCTGGANQGALICTVEIAFTAPVTHTQDRSNLQSLINSAVLPKLGSVNMGAESSWDSTYTNFSFYFGFTLSRTQPVNITDITETSSSFVVSGNITQQLSENEDTHYGPWGKIRNYIHYIDPSSNLRYIYRYWRTTDNMSFGVGSSAGNHIIYDGEDVDIKTSWLEFDSTNNEAIIGEANTNKLRLSSSGLTLENTTGMNFVELGGQGTVTYRREGEATSFSLAGSSMTDPNISLDGLMYHPPDLAFRKSLGLNFYMKLSGDDENLDPVEAEIKYDSSDNYIFSFTETNTISFDGFTLAADFENEEISISFVGGTTKGIAHNLHVILYYDYSVTLDKANYNFGLGNVLSGYNNFTYGVDNEIEGANTLILGSANAIQVDLEDLLIIGKGIKLAPSELITEWPLAEGCLALGAFPNMEEAAILLSDYGETIQAIIGTGTADSNRSNGLVLTKSGDILVDGTSNLGSIRTLAQNLGWFSDIFKGEWST